MDRLALEVELPGVRFIDPKEQSGRFGATRSKKAGQAEILLWRSSYPWG